MPRRRRRTGVGAEWQPPPEWFASPPVGQETALTWDGDIEQNDFEIGDIGQSGFNGGVARRARWRRVVGLLVVLVMLLPIIGATVLLVARLR
jgi:hypothetical protein